MNRKKRRRLSIQKLFCFISFIFIMTCCFWYGGRAIYYYMDTNKNDTNKQILARKILKDNKDKMKQVSNNYYFYKDTKNNYLIYSNLMKSLKFLETFQPY